MNPKISYAESVKLKRSLGTQLEQVLPLKSTFNLCHLSTPPSTCPAIFSAPPGSKAQRTYCESHFLAVSESANITETEGKSTGQQASQDILVFAIEVLVFTTTTLTTLFVSKADSTGFLGRTNRSGTSSIVKTISTTFLSYLAENRQRPSIPLVISLFARAQDQYLFPGSIENPEKHVLDDRGLVKWWGRVLDPILRRCPEDMQQPLETEEEKDKGLWTTCSSKAYLIVPGFDRYETLSMFPRSVREDPIDRKRWKNGHPLQLLCPDQGLPPRCLIPHFPDDPKSRYLVELDDEISEKSHSQNSTSQGPSEWKSVKSLEQFWEMMAFRQECSAGRLVGFFWILFSPFVRKIDVRKDDLLPTPENSQSQAIPAATSPRETSPSQAESQSLSSSQKGKMESIKRAQRPRSSKKSMSKKLKGPIIPRRPKLKNSKIDTPMQKQSSESPYYTWPEGPGRGEIVISEKDYKRVNDLLLRLDFATPRVAVASTQRWFSEISTISGDKKPTFTVHGSADDGTANPTSTSKSIDLLATRKRNYEDNALDDRAKPSISSLSAGLLRKKPKLSDTAEAKVGANVGPSAESVPLGVNLLGSSAIRKKPKK
ncbi:MAG: hypothetical protein M1824_004716 [Vezdaea acicularis]|nr:MAG: hypothetical protein M1824_004716 [Vezdaea acicularis]